MARKKIPVHPQPPRARPVGRRAAARSARVNVVAPKRASKKKQSSMIESNFKTELCEHWKKRGACPFGGKCAFAHGEEDVKHKTLRELCENIHDPRVKGPAEATLRPLSNLQKISSKSSRTSSSKLLGADGGDDNDLLSYPHIPRNPDSIELPADKQFYDLDPSRVYTSGRNLSAVSQMWNSYVSTIMEQNVQSITDNTSSSTAAASTSPLPRLEPLPAAQPTKASYKDAATRSMAASRATGTRARVTKTRGTRSIAAGTAAGAASNQPVTSSPVPKDSVKHLPVFLGLLKGKTLVRPDTSPLPGPLFTLGQDSGAAATGDDEREVAFSPAPSSSSVYFSPTSSPAAVSAPPSPVGRTTGVVGPRVVQLEGDSYFSCPSSPACLTAAVLKPPPGFEAAHTSKATDAWSSSSTDAASWTSSGVSSEDDNIGTDHDDGVFDSLQRFGEPMGDPWTSAAVAGESRVPTTTSRLPVFAGLHSESDYASTSIGVTSTEIISEEPSAGFGANGNGGVSHLHFPVGGGARDHDYMPVLDSGGSSAGEYGNRGGSFVRFGHPVGGALVSSKTAYGHPMPQAGHHRQQSYVDATRHNTGSIYATHLF
eukprot:g8615.t1